MARRARLAGLTLALAGAAAMTACGRSGPSRGDGTPPSAAEDAAPGQPPRAGASEGHAAPMLGAPALDAQASPAQEVLAPASPDSASSPEAFHQASIVIDTHNDVTLRLTDQPEFDFTKRAGDGHTDLVRAREGGLDAQYLSVWVNPKLYRGEEAWARSLAMFDAIERTVRRAPDQLVLATTAAGVRQAAAQHKMALLIGVEGAHALGEPSSDAEALARIRRWYDRGARYLTLTWMNSNRLGGSSGDRGRDRGLSKLGRRAVALMNDLGMIVDVSHVSDPTFFDVVEASRLPVLASHSGMRAIHDHYRNVTDDMLRAIANNGGAVCVVYYPGFLDGRWAAARRRARRTGGEIDAPPVTLAKVVEHIDHAVKLAGVDHVCLGSDFDGIGHAPAGLEDVSKLPNLTRALLDRGYSREDVAKILGGNVLRVMEANERGRREPDATASP